MRVPSKSAIEHDARLGLVLLADACRHMVRRDDQKDLTGPAMLGLEELPDASLEDLAVDHKFLTSVVINKTHFATCIRHCFDLITGLRPLEETDVEASRGEGPAWLSYYLSLIPAETVEGTDCSSKFRHPDSPLLTLLGMAEARIHLAEFIQDLVLKGHIGTGFTVREISYLGMVDVRTVRNVMGPKDNKPLRSLPRNKKQDGRSDPPRADALDALAWLAGRRGFQSGGLSTAWVSDHFCRIRTLEAAAVLPGLVTWLNGGTTNELAAVVGWEGDGVRGWLRGQNVSAEGAEALAAAVRLDPVGYRKLIARFAENHPPMLEQVKQHDTGLSTS